MCSAFPRKGCHKIAKAIGLSSEHGPIAQFGPLPQRLEGADLKFACRGFESHRVYMYEDMIECYCVSWEECDCKNCNCLDDDCNDCPNCSPYCCDDWNELSSHYHCSVCGERCSMMGHPSCTTKETNGEEH